MAAMPSFRTLQKTFLGGGLLLVLGGMLATVPVRAADTHGSISLRPTGGVGLVEMPTARMAETNTLMAGAGYLDPVGHGFLTWQALPWLETTLRWTDVRGVPDDADRSLDVKIRLFGGDGSWPALAVGFQDALGRGATSAEYIVVSQSAGDVDLSFGLSWGYLASRGGMSNPWKELSGHFADRDQGRSGVPAFNNYFSGKRMGFFGGIAYRLPVNNMELKLEYSGANAEKVAFGRPIKDKFPLNAGLSYRPFSWLEVGAGLVRGNAFSLHLALRSDPEPTRLFAVKSISPSPLPLIQRHTRTAAEYPVVEVPAAAEPMRSITGDGMLARLTKSLQDAGIERPLFEMRDGQAVLVADLPQESASEHALKAAYLVFAHLPADVTTMTLYDRVGGEIGMEGQTYSRELVVKLARADAAFNDLWRQGGVISLTLDGRDIEAQIANPQMPDEAAVSALADLAPAAGGLAAVTSAHGEVASADVSAARRSRAAADVARQLASLGLRLTGIEEEGDILRVRTEAQKPLTEEALSEAGQLTYAILHEVEPERRVTLEVHRAGDVLATQALPGGALEQARMAEKEPVFRPGMRYLPLFGYVPWSNVTAPAPPPAWASATLTDTEARSMFAAAEAQGLTPIAARGSQGGVELAVAQHKVTSPAAAVGRAGRAMAAAAPASAQKLSVTLVDDGVALGRARFWREDLEKAAAYRGSPEEVWLHTELDRPRTGFDPDQGWMDAESYPRFHWWVGPQVQQHFGSGPADHYRAAIRAAAGASLELFPGIEFEGVLSRELVGNLEDIPARSGTTVPHVRSDIGRYAAEGKTALSRFTASWTLEPVRNVFVRASGGLYEPMFGGVGLEALWRPYAGRWAVGAEGYWLKARDYDQKFGFRGESSWTGHLSLYHEWRRAGLTGVVRVGRYLAEDYGGTLELYRTFDNGIRIGGYATLTDMSRADYGGGGFTKGFYITIPLAAVLGWHHLGETTVPFALLNRDGGQRLDRGRSLYDLTTPGSAWELTRRWGNLMR